VAAFSRDYTMPSEPQLPRVGDVIDRGKYRIDALIGEGGMGAVFAATHMQMGGKRRAIKWLLPKLARDENAVRRFLAEANIAARIDHPNVVSPIDVSVDSAAPYIVMELLEGETLGQYLGDRRLPLDKAGSIFMPILQGVAAAHDQNIVHRDLKPGNIFLARWSGAGLVPKVLDFGIAKVLDARQTFGTLTDHGVLLGTIHYMSPEQLRNASDVSPQTDVYALAVILYRMLSANLPYEGNLLDLALRIREGRPTPLSSHVQALPAGLEDVLMRALSASLERRYRDVRSFAQALSPYFPQHGLDFGPALRPSTPKAISELPPERAIERSADASKLRDSSAPRSENSTFHPIATKSRTSRSSRAWVWAGAIGVVLIAAGVIVGTWSDSEQSAEVTPDDGAIVKPAPPAALPVAAAGQRSAPAQALSAKPDAGEEPARDPGWDDLGSGGAPQQEPPAAADTTPVRPRPPRKPRDPKSATAPGSSLLDTILEHNTQRLDTIHGTNSPER
jgi:serine/threonine protein kinase